MKSILLGALCLLLAGETIAAGAIQWTWEAGKQTNNGSISIKSVNGGSTYPGSQNPTGAIARTNQSAVTQPPTVIIQATGGSGGMCVGTTRTLYDGNLGGLSGADAKCVAEFGSGWRFASIIDAAGCMGGVLFGPGGATVAPWYHNPGSSYTCANWTTNSGANGSYLSPVSSSGVPVLDWGNTSCSGSRPLICVKNP